MPGHVSEATATFEQEQAAIFWLHGAQVLRSAHVVDHAWLARNAAILDRKPTLAPISEKQRAAWDALMAANPPAAADSADIATARALLPHRRPTAKGNGRPMLPYPVYCARYADGSQQRISFWSTAGKPIDFARGYNAAMIIGRAVPVDGYVDLKGTHREPIRDPHFEAVAVPTKQHKETAARRLAAICKALNEGEIDAALLMARDAA